MLAVSNKIVSLPDGQVWRTSLGGGCCPSSYLENALTGYRWSQPALEMFLGARNNQEIRRLEDQRKKESATLSHLSYSRN